MIRLNGEDHHLADSMTLEAFLVKLDVLSTRLAVEVNERIVPRSAYASTRLKMGDQVELIQAVGGG